MKKQIAPLAILLIGIALFATSCERKSKNELYTGPYHDPVPEEMRLERDMYLNRINNLVNNRNLEEAALLCDTLERICPQSPVCFMTGGIISHKLNDSIQSKQRLTRAKEIYDSLIVEHNDSRDMQNNLLVIRTLHGKEVAKAALEEYMERGLHELDTLQLSLFQHIVNTDESLLDEIWD